MPPDLERPPALPPRTQILLGLLTGVSLVGLTALVAIVGIPLPRYWWAGVFLAIYAATYISLKFRLRVLVVATMITGTAAAAVAYAAIQAVVQR